MMKTTQLAAFLLGWPDVWHHGLVWRTIHTEDATVGDLQDAYLRDLASPTEPEEIAEALLEDGAFAAAETLLQDPGYLEAAKNLDIDDLQSELTRRRIESQANVLAISDEFLRRSRRAAAGIAKVDARLQEAYRWATRDTMKSRAALAAVRIDVERAEAELADDLRNELSDQIRLLSPDRAGVAAWQAAVERALHEKHFDVVKSLLAANPDTLLENESERLVLPLGLGPFGNEDPAEICRWSLDGVGGPPDFYAYWDPLKGGPSARAILQALHAICISQSPTIDQVLQFVIELERLIDPAVAYEREIEPIDGGFRTTLHVLEDVACPVLPAGGVSLYIEVERGLLRAGIEPDARPSIVFSKYPECEADGNFSVLTPWDIHRCLARPMDFRFNLLHIICTQLRADRFPTVVPTSWMMVGRRTDLERIRDRLSLHPQLVAGPAGSGKTAVLDNLVAAMAEEGWSTHVVPVPLPGRGERAQNSSGPSRVLQELGDAFGTNLLTPSSPGVLLAIDDGHKIPPTHLNALLTWSEGMPDCRRLIACGDPSLWARVNSPVPTEDQKYRVELLSFGTVRSFAERVLYLNGYQLASASVLDRIAFYSAGRLSLLHALLRALFLELLDSGVPRRAGVTLNSIEYAFGRGEYQDAARAILLKPAESDVALHITLAASLLVFDLCSDRPGLNESAVLADVAECLRMEEIELPPSRLTACIDQLRGLALVDVLPESRLALSSVGGGHIVVSLIGDRADYFTAAKTRMILELGAAS